MRTMLLSLLFIASSLGAADAPYLLDEYGLPQGASGWQAKQICGNYAYVTSTAMFKKREGATREDAYRFIYRHLDKMDNADPEQMKDTMVDILRAVYTNKLPAVENYRIVYDTKKRCLRVNGFAE